MDNLEDAVQRLRASGGDEIVTSFADAMTLYTKVLMETDTRASSK
jgi:hypothetical protein